MQQIRKIQLVAFIIAVALLEMSHAQRPSYAGSRPSGLSQKDKYNVNNNSNVSDIANRFGTVEQNTSTVPFGASQKPPAAHIGVVFPESNYVPLAVPTPSPNVIGNRFGGGSDATANAIAGVAAGAAVGGNNVPQRLPIDAHNDNELVDIISRLPEDKRPFWFLNAAAIEAQRNGSFVNYAGAVDSRGSFFG